MRSRPTARRRVLPVLTLLLLAASCSGPSKTTTSPTADNVAAGKPNVLFVLTDDMRLDDLQFMPQVHSIIGDQGMSFDDYFDNVTLCCPARTSILRGQY